MIEINAIIVDDEIHGARSLKALLDAYCPDVKVIGTAHSAASAMELIANQAPDLLFLDIEMPDANGFQLLEQLGNIKFDVIFTTAYAQFALQAFKTNAVSYLLKPIDADELIAAIDKIKSNSNNQTLQRLKMMESMISDIKTRQTKLNRVAIHTSEGITILDAENIIRFEADSNYTHIFLSNGKKITSAKTMKEYEETLEQMNFLRIHHTHMVNLRFIDRYIKGEGGYVVTSDNITLEVSRRKKPLLLAALGKSN